MACDSPDHSWLLALPSDLLLATLRLLEPQDLRQVRLVSKHLHTSATAAVTTLRPTASAVLPAFSALTDLDLAGVHVDNWDESQLCTLGTLLTCLRLGRCNLLSPVGAQLIASLPSLRSLETDDPFLTDSTLQRWTSLTALTFLALRDCSNVTDKSLPAALRAMPLLQDVELGRSKLGDGVLRVLGSLPHLTKLQLRMCHHFTADGITALGQAPALRQLQLPACWQLDDGAAQALAAALPQLELLGMLEAGEALGDAGLAKLGALQGLTALDLAYSCWEHTAVGLRSLLQRLPRLQMLNVGGAEGMCDAVLQAIGTLTALTTLDVSKCQRVTTAGLRHVAQLPQLEDLRLGWNLRLQDSAVQALAVAPSARLTKLDLSFCCEITDEGVAAAAALALRCLVLRNCNRVGDAGAAALARCTTLRRLNVSCTALTTQGMRHLATLPQLESLIVSGCRRTVTPAGLSALAAAPALRLLDLSDSKWLDDAGMQALGQLEQLHYLLLRGCVRITDNGVAALLGARSLRVLMVHGCFSVTPRGLQLLLQLPFLRSVRYPGVMEGMGLRDACWPVLPRTES